MSRTLPRSTAAKRRGVVLAVAAGALALGATAPASASASPSSSASAAAAKAKTKIAVGDTVRCRTVHGVKPAKPAKPVKLSEAGKATAGERAEAGKTAAMKLPAASKGRSHGRDDICAIPAFPTHPGKTCKVVVIKRGSGKTDSVPALPAKPGKHTTPTTPAKPGKPMPTKPGKPGKPGKICVIVLAKDGHWATKSSADAKTTAVEATRATRS
ncbi:hypothetical protein [Streptomyces rhizosphaericus]|uniref:Tat pathway signal sequence domain protein n=1 Tax=Streptomyces rhizosphaericus TaxID=114699 RepID=A0ABP4BJG1_9ACTN|nr:hypothetical protein [Streptomyces cangkringensis]